MAKENTHCKFSYNVLNKKNLDSNIKSILEKNSLVYLYGSAFPDSFYYTKSTEKLSIDFHTGDLDYQELIINFLQKRREDIEIAFLLGVISHIFLDLTIHPFVNRECGKDDHCHLKLETEFDKLYSKDWNFFTSQNRKLLKKLFPFHSGNDFINQKHIGIKKVLTTHFFYNQFFRSETSALVYKLFFKHSPKYELFYKNEAFKYSHEETLDIVKNAEDNLVGIYNRFLNFRDQKISKEEFFGLFPEGCLDGF